MKIPSAAKAHSKKFLLRQAGKVRWQRFFETLHEVSLLGMHIGQGASVESSGEANALQAVAAAIPAGPLTIFDVGANVGDYATCALSILGQRANVFSFEPSPTTFAALSARTATLPAIEALPFGLSDSPGTKTLYADKEGSGLASVYRRRLDHFGLSMQREETIPMRSLDQFAAERVLARIHLLKLDVEGHELSVLRGAERYLAEDRIDFIQFEFGGCNIDSHTYFQDFYYLLKDRYDLFRIVKDGLHPLPGYKESYEIFLTSNFFAAHQRHDLASVRSPKK